MFDTARHVPLRAAEWVPSEAQAAIDEIVADTLAQFNEARFWPAHPQDDGAADGETSIYFGATGVIWALDYLARVGATRYRGNFVPVLDRLIDASRRQFAWGCTARQRETDRSWSGLPSIAAVMVQCRKATTCATFGSDLRGPRKIAGTCQRATATS